MNTDIESYTANTNLLSIITVTLNDLASLKTTIKNIGSQEFRPFEYIIIDGGSTDGTQNSLEKYEDHIGCFISEPDQGIYDAMNKGFERAGGEWINFLNAGDTYYDPEVIRDIFSRDMSGVDIIYGDSIADYGSFKVYKKAGDPIDLWKGMNIRHQTIFIRSSLIKKEMFNLDYPLGADYDLVYKLHTENKKFLYIPEPIVIFDPFGISNTKFLKVTKEHYRISKKYTGYSLYMYFVYGIRLSYLSLINFTRWLLPERSYLKLIKFINRKHLVSI